jgi:flagellar hook assembly protein FlgD
MRTVFSGSVSAGGRLVGDAMAQLGEVRVTPDEEGGASIRFPVERDTGGVVEILNSLFEPVRWFEVGATAASEAEIRWDFKNQAGQRVPSGEYYSFVKVGTAERYGRVHVGTK